jgi:acetyltransferase
MTTTAEPTGMAMDQDATWARAMEGLFHPKRVAIVGATPRPGFANSIHGAMLTSGYEGEIFGVTPRYEEVLGAPCYPTIDAIPGGVDKVIVVVPSNIVLDVLGQAERAGVKAVNIITSGFGEQSDEAAHQRQEEIRAFARRTGIRIVGPNCLGIISTPAKMVAKSGPYATGIPRGPVGLVFQSGLLAYSAVLPPIERGIGFTYVITTGNEADLDATDFMRYYVEDEETRVIGCFIEQFRDPDKLLRVAQMAAERQKPLVILKVGRSEAGRKAAQAHTGSLVGSDAIADAIMRQYGIVRVYNLDEMNETLAVFHSKLPKGPGVGTIFVSGGACGVISDLSQDLGISLPSLAPETVAKLTPVIPEYGTVGNPLDTTGQAATQPEIMEGSLVSMAEDPNIHTVIYGQAYPNKVDLATPVGSVLKTMPERYPDKVFLIMSLVGGRMQEGRWRNQDPVEPVTHWDGVPFLQGAENGLRAVRSLIQYADFQRLRQESGPHPTATPSKIASQARELVIAGGGKPLVERAAKEVLALYDIPVTRERLATNADEAVAAAREIGYPVVLKIESQDIAHKTEAGGVLLNVADDETVRSGFAQVVGSARNYKPEAVIAGVLVQEMVSGGREMILGMTQDAAYGPAIAVGLGGIFVEVLKDVALGVPPLTPHDSRMLLNRLRGKAILEGVRGGAPADTDAIVDILGKFAQLCVDLRDEVSEIDINPLLVFDKGKGARVVDCLIVPSTPGVHD